LTITVTDAHSQEFANQTLLTIAQLRKQVVDTWKPMKDAAYKAHRTVCEQERKVDAPLAQADTHLRTQVSNYIRAEQQRAREEEQRIERENRERADREAKQEAERLAIEDAIQLEAEGKQEEAEAVLAAPMPVPARYIPTPPIAAQVAKTAGVSSSTVVKFEIVDASKVPDTYKTIDMVAIGKVVKALGLRAQDILGPGVRVYDDVQLNVSKKGA
jgi:hypothetical protein